MARLKGTLMSEQAGPRIGIVGAGAIGGFYGLLLARAGFDVHFLLRSDYPVVREQGWHLESCSLGTLCQPVKVYEDAAAMPRCDWLLLACKTTSNAELAPLLAQVAVDNARVVLLQNGLGVEEAVRPLLPDSLHLLGGLCFICVHRAAPGKLVHQAQGSMSLGYHSGPGEQGAAVLAEGVALLRAAGIDARGVADLQQARWQKLVWNVPFNGLSVVLNAHTGMLLGNPATRELVQTLMEEVIAAAVSAGCTLPAGYAQTLLKVTESMPDYWPSMHHDYRHARPLELAAIYAQPLQRARAMAVEMPATRMLYQQLEFLQEGAVDGQP